MKYNKIYLVFLFILFFSKNSFAQDSFDQNEGFFVKPLATTIDGITTTDVTTCYGGDNGTITIGASGGAPPYEYSIVGVNGGAYQASNFFSGLSENAYEVWVRDVNNASEHTFAFVGQPSEITITNEARTNVTGCYGDANGTFTITASGGTGALQYSIASPADYLSNGGSFVGVDADTYTIRVRDANNCIQTGNSITVSQPPELLITNEVVTHVTSCFGDCNATIDIIVTGGTSPINYSIDNGATSKTAHLFSGLCAGNYDIRVEDANGCIEAGNAVTIDQPAPLVIDSEGSWDVTTCNGYDDGSITVTASGGTGSIRYSIDGGNFYQITGNFPDLYDGTYDIAVIDQNLCIITGSTLVINEPSLLVINSESQTDVALCHGDLTGEIVINASGGTPGLEYTIDNGSTYQAGNTFSGIGGGTYQVLVRDAQGCTTNGQSHFISQPFELIINDVTPIDVTDCFGGSNGSLTISASGGTGTIEYQANAVPYQTDNEIDGLSAGDYNVRVRDANSCVTDWSGDETISEPEQIVITGEYPTNPSCFGENSGQIEITSTGGIGTIYYSVNGGTNYFINNTITGLSAGIPYLIMVKDGHDCTITGGTHTLTEPAELIIDSEIVTDITSCFGDENGSIVINASGGSAPISYTINGGADYQASNTFLNLAAGTYQIIVRDNNNCITTGSNAEITQPGQLTVTNQLHTDIYDCNGINDGTITINSSGGTAPITYTITGSNTYSNNTGIFTNLPADIYSVSIEDANGCTASGTNISVDEPEVLVLSLSEKNDIECNGEINGSIILGSAGGQLPHQYSINGGVSFTTATNFENLAAGTYNTFVRDIYNCIQAGPVVVINEPAEIQITNITTENITQCFGDATGSIAITAVGGTPDLQYSVNSGATYDTNSIISGLTAGDYNIIVRDENYCTRQYPSQITISQPPEITFTSINSSSISCTGNNDGSIDIIAGGGTGNLEYSIENPANFVDNGGAFTNLSQGLYTIRIQDANNCIKSGGTVTIYEPTQVIINNVSVYNESCEDENDGRIIIYASGGTAPYEYNLNGGPYQTSRIIENLSPGDYTPNVIDNNGCSATATTVTISSPESSATFTTDIVEGCSPLVVTFTRDTDGQTYLWDFGDGNTSTLNHPTHTFINATDSPADYIITSYSRSLTGCYDTARSTVNVSPQPALSFTADPALLYYPDATVTITNNSPAGYTDYLWNFGDGTETTSEHPGSHTYETCGIYIISVSALNTWCSDTVESTVEITYHQPTAVFDLDTTNGCTPLAIEITNQSDNTTGYEWIFGDGNTSNEQTPTHTYNETGTYTLILNTTGQCGSTASYDTIINVWKKPDVDFTVDPDTVMLPSQPIHCYNYSASENPTYLWDFGDGGTSTGNDPIHFYTEAGYYQISLTVTSMYGCVDSLTLDKNVIVLPAGNIEFPDAFTPDGDGMNDVFKPRRYESVVEYEISIYNRWG